jgi:uncharacterized protein (TIGR02679 family)
LLRLTYLNAMSAVPEEARASKEAIWDALKRTGWVARLVSEAADGERLVRMAAEVICALPQTGIRLDRRHLAADTTGDPHALDQGTTLAGLTLAILVAAGRVPARRRPREAWACVGVDCDDVVGGLFAVGILPVDWILPAGGCTTIPPRVLASCTWPRVDTVRPWIFVTENPSIAAAAADLAQGEAHIRLLCMIGKPSFVEIAAIGRLAERGWHIAVRADFDAAGLQHVDAVLKRVPGARPWRMGTLDYVQSLQVPNTDRIALDEIPDTSWDVELAAAMRERGTAAFEEALLRELLEDLRLGRPG